MEKIENVENVETFETFEKVPHPLNSGWQFWEHDKSCTGNEYAMGVKKIGSVFDTVEEFWGYFSAIPKPSEIFTLKDKNVINRFENRAIDEYSMFKENIKPEWEHEKNINGGYLRMIFIESTVKQIDDYWNRLVFEIIGETLDPENEICGIRMVDKFKKKNNKYEFKFIIEIWFGCSIGNEKYIQKMQENIKKCIQIETELTFIKTAHNKSLQNSRDYLKK